MFKFNLSNYDLLDVGGAAKDVAVRIRERHPGDPVMLDRADQLDSTSRAVASACEGIDTRPATAEIMEKDQIRDNDVRVMDCHLQVHMMSPLHSDTIAAARELHAIIAGDGLGWLDSAFSAESARLDEILDRLEAKSGLVAAVGLTPYLAQTRKSHAEYLKARDSRDLLIENRPEVVAAVRSPLRNAIRSTLLLLAEPARAGHAAYILEPLARLRPRRAAVTPVAPAPTV